jgi:hypothetical protein
MPVRLLTVGQIARDLQQPEWKIRRIVDSLGVEIVRAGLYRLVNANLLPKIKESLREQATGEAAK